MGAGDYGRDEVSALFQFSTTVIGSATGAVVERRGFEIRKRWPSAVTSHACTPGMVGNSRRGSDVWIVSPAAFTSTAMKSPAADLKNNSLPSLRQRGTNPPVVDTRHLAPTEGLPSAIVNGRTYTSFWPDSFETIHHPSAIRRQSRRGFGERRLQNGMDLLLLYRQGEDIDVGGIGSSRKEDEPSVGRPITRLARGQFGHDRRFIRRAVDVFPVEVERRILDAARAKRESAAVG